MAKVFIGNQHTGGITFPRKVNGVALPPIRIAPGTVAEVEEDWWKQQKSNKVVQGYLAAGILVEVKRPTKEKAVPVGLETTSEPPIPEHLQSADEQGGVERETATGTGKPGKATAKVKKATPGTVKVK